MECSGVTKNIFLLIDIVRIENAITGVIGDVENNLGAGCRTTTDARISTSSNLDAVAIERVILLFCFIRVVFNELCGVEMFKIVVKIFRTSSLTIVSHL